MASRWLLAEPVLVLDSNMSEVVAVTPTGGPTRQESVTHIKRHKLASCNVPLVHGRPNPSISPRSRLTTHQRNHSLDFRYIYIFWFRHICHRVQICLERPFSEYFRATLRAMRASYLRDVTRLARTSIRPGTCWISDRCCIRRDYAIDATRLGRG